MKNISNSRKKEVIQAVLVAFNEETKPEVRKVMTENFFTKEEVNQVIQSDIWIGYQRYNHLMADYGERTRKVLNSSEVQKVKDILTNAYNSMQ